MEKGNPVTRPSEIYKSWYHEKEYRDFDPDVPPPVPEKDEGYTPSIPSRPMTRSTDTFTLASDRATSRRKIKYGTGKYSHVELIPQPSDDPNDPLNWPRWRKELNLVALLSIVALIGAMKTVFVTTNGAMAQELSISYISVAALTAVPLIISTFTGMASLVAAKFVGKRPVYLVSFIVVCLGSIVNIGTEKTYDGTMAARSLQGIGWGAFDTLLLGSIQDTFFEHERNVRVSIYNVFMIATTWGSPLIGGYVSQTAGTFTAQFRILSALFIVVIPLLVFGAPETVFDRSRASIVKEPVTPDPSTPLPPQQAPLSKAIFTKENFIKYAKSTTPWSYRAKLTKATLLQAPRAFVAPTTVLVFLISFIPYCFLWGFANTVAMVVTPMPINMTTDFIGILLTGPWLFATLIVTFFCFWRYFHEQFAPRVNLITIASGTALVAAGITTFGLTVYTVMTRGSDGISVVVNPNADKELNLPLLSFLLGMLAAGVYVLDASTRPLIARSASFTSSNMAIAQRCIGDMHASVVVLRSFFAGIFIMGMPDAVSSWAGLRATVIGFSVAQVGVAACIAALWWFYDETIWRADGRLMRLVDMSILKRSASFFDA